MANQVTVSNDHSINVTIEPPANVQVQVSRAVIGAVANVPTANFANYAGNVTVSAQPNITSLGTLTSLTSNGNITAPFFIGNIIGNISGNITVPGSNTAVLFNQLGNAGASDALKFNYASNVLTANGNIVANYFIGNGSQLTGLIVPQSNNANFANFANFAGNAFSVSGSNVTGAVAYATTANSVAGANVSGAVAYATTANAVAGANVSGAVAFATTANSVTLANVSGAGNIASINITGNLSQILYGNGVFAAIPTVSNVGNANYANFAGEAFSVSASNIVGTVNLANFATTANAVAGANVSGEVANATYANTSGSATTAGTVTTNAQPNITSVGTLTGLTVSGNILPNANITYDLGNNTNRFKDLYLAGNSIILGAQTISANATGISVTGNLSGDASGLANITGANVTGQVGNALVASTVYTNAQPNITSVGTLTSANISGDALVAGNLTVGGNISYVNVNNLVVQDPVIELGGGPNGAPLTTNDGKDRGTLLHYYTTNPVDAFMGWDNGNGEFAFGSNVTNNLDVMTFNTLGNVRAQTFIGNLTGIASSATIANSANAVAGANVSGQVNYAAVANSVAVGNVSGIGNVATLNLDGNLSNILYGNGVFAAVPNVSNVANANFANFAGNAFSVSGSNVSGAVGLANFATTANAVAGANVSGAVGLANFATTANAVAGANVSGAVAFATTANSVALSNVSGAGNIASINLDGNVSNLLTGAGTYVAIPTVSSNANYANFAGEAFSVNASNIVGTVNLANFATTANAVAGANVSGAVAFATTANSVAGANVSGAVGLASFATVANSVSGSNVTSQVANALIAGTVYTNAQPNITSVGTLSSLAISGNVTSNNANLGNLVTANFFSGNGSLLTGVIAAGGANISNGNSNVSISTAGGNVTVGVNGTSNVMVISNNSANITGTLNASTQVLAPLFLGNRLAIDQSTLTSTSPGLQTIGTWNNSAVTFDGVIVNYTDTASNANSNLLRLRTTSVDKFTVNKSGNVNFAGVITGDGSGLSNIAPGNLSANVNFANTAGTVTTNAQPNITSVGVLSDLNIDGTLGLTVSSSSNTAGRFIVNQASGVGTGLTSNLFNTISQKWNNSSIQFTTLVVGATDVTSDANSLLFNATTNSASKFSINKSGNVVFAGVMTGDGGGLSNISGIGGSSISNGTSNVSIPVSNGNVNISVGGTSNVAVITGTGVNVAGTLNATGNISGTQLISNIAIGTAPFVVTSTTQVANLNVASAGLATFATTANAVAGANVSGAVAFATTANSVALGNVSGAGNIASINLDGSSSNVLYGNGVFAAGGGGGGTPGGSNTQLQFNNAGSFGGISTVTWDGSNISLGAVGTVKVTGGVNNEVIRTDGTGNLSFSSIAQTLLVGTRAGPYTVPITNYTFQVTTRSSGNVTVYVN